MDIIELTSILLFYLILFWFILLVLLNDFSEKLVHVVLSKSSFFKLFFVLAQLKLVLNKHNIPRLSLRLQFEEFKFINVESLRILRNAGNSCRVKLLIALTNVLFSYQIARPHFHQLKHLRFELRIICNVLIVSNSVS